MNKLVYLHIGPAKTATTTLQWILYNNKEILNKHNICYPYAGSTFIDGESSKAHQNISFQMMGEPLRDIMSGGIDELIEEISNTEFEKYIVSSEGLYGIMVHKPKTFLTFVNKLKKYANVEIVCAWRPDDQQLESLYCETFKQCRHPGDFDIFIDKHIYNRSNYYQPLSDLANLGYKIHIVPFLKTVPFIEVLVDLLTGIDLQYEKDSRNTRDGYKALSAVGMALKEINYTPTVKQVREFKEVVKNTLEFDDTNYTLSTKIQRKLLQEKIKEIFMTKLLCNDNIVVHYVDLVKEYLNSEWKNSKQLRSISTDNFTKVEKDQILRLIRNYFEEELLNIDHNNDVIFGKEDYLFLYQGTNKNYDYLVKKEIPDMVKIKGYLNEIKDASLYTMNEIRAQYFYTIFPNKERYCWDLHPKKSSYKEPFSIASYYNERLTSAGVMVLSEPDIKSKKVLFSKTDTHFSFEGKTAFSNTILNQIFKYENNKNYNYEVFEYSGDLGNRYVPKKKEEGKRLVFTNKPYTVSNAVVNQGNLTVFINPDAEINAKILIFGDSFYKSLLPFLAEKISTIVFHHGNMFLKDLTNYVNPDVILHGYIERFLTKVPTSVFSNVPYLDVPNLLGKSATNYASLNNVLAYIATNDDRYLLTELHNFKNEKMIFNIGSSIFKKTINYSSKNNMHAFKFYLKFLAEKKPKLFKEQVHDFIETIDNIYVLQVIENICLQYDYTGILKLVIAKIKERS